MVLKHAIQLINYAFIDSKSNSKSNNLKVLSNVSEPNVYYLIVPDKLYTVAETAQLLRVKKDTIYKWNHYKKIKSTKSGGKLLFLGRNIKAYLGL